MYHQLCAAVPGNTTLKDRTECEHLHMSDGTLTLHHACRQRTYICLLTGVGTRRHNARPEGPAFQYELFPVRSPLLREACSVSTPPLIYMLKFSRYSGLKSGLYKTLEMYTELKCPQ